MRTLGLLLVLCSALCWAQREDEQPFEVPLPPQLGGELLPETVEGMEEPLVRCKRPLCNDMFCSYGHAVGEDGCPICQCKTPADICEEFGECPEGQRCHVPTCSGELCGAVKARCITECAFVKCVVCESGIYLHDEQGCQTCECGSMPCAVPMCSNECEHGYANNEFGCMTCTCNPHPGDDSSEEVSHARTDGRSHIPEDVFPEFPAPEDGCSRAMCRMFCEYGFERDERGCEVCRCRSEPEPEPDCPKAMCFMFCEHGFETDARGCDTCKCRDEVHPEGCPEVMCAMFCENGFEKNDFGCDICKCKLTGQENVCNGIECMAGLTCHPVIPTDCVGCSSVPLCRPYSICQLHEGQMLGEEEMQMMMHHLQPSEVEKFFPGPAKCLTDGSFEPKQCFEGQCFCVDDRGVMQSKSIDQGQDMQCKSQITKVLNLSFQLEHDLDDNDLDGALSDIQRLVETTVGDWMSISKKSILTVQVVYLKPGLLVVEINVEHDGLTDLPSAAHHMHKQMRDGLCDIPYKDHILRPKPETITAQHTYDEPIDEPTICWFPTRRSPILVACLISGIVGILIIITVILVAAKRKRSASYQFKHKRMENMETFKKNLIMSTEWEKPDLVCKDDVKVSFSDEIKKPLA